MDRTHVYICIMYDLYVLYYYDVYVMYTSIHNKSHVVTAHNIYIIYIKVLQ